uniref:Ribosomal protein L5 n=1 Tax=Fucus distichus TaxID=3012 RepID=A0A343C621_FUCDI|nr:ribosomal protein L5 [Fucus distichus]ARI50024.1 ribosomal protein L5 [Fucus distichus]
MHPYQNHYHDVVQKDLILCNNVKTASKLPVIKKMSVYLGSEKADSNYVVSFFAGLKIISGQTPILIKKKTFSRLGGNRDIVGGKVTLRGCRSYSFIYKLLFDVFPGIRQFDGLKLPAHSSIYCFVLKDIFVFEELIPLFPYFEDLSNLQCQFYFNTNNRSDILFLGNSLQLCFIP